MNVSVHRGRVLARILKMSDPKQQFQNLCPSTFSVKKGISQFSYLLKDGLLGKDLIITPQKFKIENLQRSPIQVLAEGVCTGPY